MLIISNIAANTTRAFIRIPLTSCASSFVVFISKLGASVNHDLGDTEQNWVNTLACHKLSGEVSRDCTWGCSKR